MTNRLIPGDTMRSVRHLDAADERMRRLSESLETLRAFRGYATEMDRRTVERIDRKRYEIDRDIAGYLEKHPELIARYCTLEHAGETRVTADDDAVIESLNADDGNVRTLGNGRVVAYQNDDDDDEEPVRLDRVVILNSLKRM